MFGIFKKKVSFLEVWKGTPEIHCHVLPGIDDGAKDVSTSIELLKKYAALGCPKIIATPHTMGGIYDNTPETIAAARAQVGEDTSGIDVSFSSEYMLDDNFNELLHGNRLIPLKEKFLLVEISFFQPPMNLYEQIFEIGTRDFRPIMAHPERYAYYHNSMDVYKELKTKGCLLQLNALSLTPHYGEAVQKTAFKLLEAGLYDFIGLDTHRMDHLQKVEEMSIPEKYKEALLLVCARTQQTFL